MTGLNLIKKAGVNKIFDITQGVTEQLNTPVYINNTTAELIDLRDY